MNIPAIQQALAADQLDGWLLYDFRGSNPIAADFAGLAGAHTTRRWYYFIPVSGTPRKLVHGVEPNMLDGLPGDKRAYSERQALERGVAALLNGARTVAMEYSPGCAIPYVSRVDAGTVEFIRSLGVSVVSSADLVSRFQAAWGPPQLASHREASARLHEIKDRAFAWAGERVAAGAPVNEFEIQQRMSEWIAAAGLVTDSGPIVAVGPNAGNPHYGPSAEGSRAFGWNELLLLDLWAKLDQPGSVYADITWVGFSGQAPERIAQAFSAIVAGRDASVDLVTSRVAAGLAVRGWEVDRAARDVIAAAGFGDQFIHRTGHSLGESVHGNGANMDDFETHDDRRLLPGAGFTIEPGVYTQEFGVRTEINMVVGERTAEVTGPRQMTITRIG